MFEDFYSINSIYAPTAGWECNRTLLKGGRDREILSPRPKIHPPWPSLKTNQVMRPNLETLNISRGHRPREILINIAWGHRPKAILRVSRLGQVTRWVKRRGPRGVDWGPRGMDFLVNLPTWSRVRTFSPKLEGLRLNWRENIIRK